VSFKILAIVFQTKVFTKCSPFVITRENVKITSEISNLLVNFGAELFCESAHKTAYIVITN
jgi:hypothetical protein